MKSRSQIDEKFKWDLSSYISNEKEIDETFKIMENLIKVFPTYKGKLNDKEILLEIIHRFG